MPTYIEQIPITTNECGIKQLNTVTLVFTSCAKTPIRSSFFLSDMVFKLKVPFVSFKNIWTLKAFLFFR